MTLYSIDLQALFFFFEEEARKMPRILPRAEEQGEDPAADILSGDPTP